MSAILTKNHITVEHSFSPSPKKKINLKSSSNYFETGFLSTGSHFSISRGAQPQFLVASMVKMKEFSWLRPCLLLWFLSTSNKSKIFCRVFVASDVKYWMLLIGQTPGAFNQLNHVAAYTEVDLNLDVPCHKSFTKAATANKHCKWL